MKVQFNNIPEGIRGKPLYCLAKLEQKPGKNKPDKIPYQITGARASPNNFKSLAEIEAVFKKGGYDAKEILIMINTNSTANTMK